MSTILDVRGLRKSYGARTVLDGVDLQVGEREKVGVIGRNGSGKSTLFRILADLEGYEHGTIALRNDVRVGFLPQEPIMEPTRTALEVAGEGLREGSADWETRHRVEAVLTRLGVTDLSQVVGDMSGGERRRVALARTLVGEPDLLLLDEPTNHLDADTVLWLEETLFDFPGAALIVTHDRYFLDRVVDRMLEVGPRGITSYDGGYTEYLEERTEREAREQVEEGRRRRFLEKELAWARRSPPARTGKQKARRRRAKSLAREQREADRNRSGSVHLEMSEAPPRLGSRVLELHGVSLSYGEQVIVRDFSERLLAGERVGVVGPNGVGKSTLLRLVVGEEEPDEGEVILGQNTRIGYFDQDRELDPDLSVERAVSELDRVRVGGREIHLRAYLDRFLFPPESMEQKVSSLSGGERNRVLLARLLLQDFNLLVLDEPTNDLDLDTLRVLEDALESFPGCLLMVTHDRYLLDRLATSLLVFEGEGRIHRHHGSWDSYLARREEEAALEKQRSGEEERRRKEKRASRSRERAREAPERKRLSYHEKRELEGMEGRIEELERERDELGTRLADPELYQSGEGDVGGTTRRYREVEEELEAVYARWMELEERAP